MSVFVKDLKTHIFYVACRGFSLIFFFISTNGRWIYTSVFPFNPFFFTTLWTKEFKYNYKDFFRVVMAEVGGGGWYVFSFMLISHWIFLFSWTYWRPSHTIVINGFNNNGIAHRVWRPYFISNSFSWTIEKKINKWLFLAW